MAVLRRLRAPGHLRPARGAAARRCSSGRIGYEPPLVSLRENCRNLPRVAHLAAALGQVDGGYRTLPPRRRRVRPAGRLLRRGQDGEEGAVDALDTLACRGFRAGADRRAVSAERRALPGGAVDQSPLAGPAEAACGGWAGGYTGYDSIFRFKGREAPAIVITDIDPLDADGRWSDDADVRSLLYVGVTRALSRVVVLAHEYWRDRLDVGADGRHRAGCEGSGGDAGGWARGL